MAIGQELCYMGLVPLKTTEPFAETGALGLRGAIVYLRCCSDCKSHVSPAW